MRGALYVDGYNLYHAINDLGQPYLKWLNLRRLGEILARGHSKTIERIVYCTAFFPGDHGKKNRHQYSIDALSQYHVETVIGHTTKEPLKCRLESCGHQWDVHREKETDINLALSLYQDAVSDVYDVAFLVTADTDQVSTLKFMRRFYPHKKVFVIVPPSREPSKHLRDLADGTIKMNMDHLDLSVLPAVVGQQGFRSIIRPYEYTPPTGWVHPDDRPKKSIMR